MAGTWCRYGATRRDSSSTFTIVSILNFNHNSLISNTFLITDDIKNIYLNKTEIAYVLNMPSSSQSAGSRRDQKPAHRPEAGQIESRAPGLKKDLNKDKEPFDSQLNFIFVVQPFT